MDEKAFTAGLGLTLAFPHLSTLSCIGLRPSSNVCFPVKTLQIPPHWISSLSLLLFSVPLPQNHSLGLCLNSSIHYYCPPAQLLRKTGSKSDLCPQLLAGCLACGVSECLLICGRKLLPFLPLKKYLLCYQPPSLNIQCDDPKPTASVLVMNCRIGHPILKRSSVSLF